MTRYSIIKTLKGIIENGISINDKQFVNNLKEPISIFKVAYSYTTVRGNKKVGEKYFIENTYNPQFDIEGSFNKYIKNYNNEFKNRQLLNVKFLNSEFISLLD